MWDGARARASYVAARAAPASELFRDVQKRSDSFSNARYARRIAQRAKRSQRALAAAHRFVITRFTFSRRTANVESRATFCVGASRRGGADRRRLLERRHRAAERSRRGEFDIIFARTDLAHARRAKR